MDDNVLYPHPQHEREFRTAVIPVPVAADKPTTSASCPQSMEDTARGRLYLQRFKPDYLGLP